MPEKVYVNMNVLDTVQDALKADMKIFYANRMFDLCASVEKYMELLTPALPSNLYSPDASNHTFILIEARLENEVYLCAIEKAHPIHMGTTYLVRNSSQRLLKVIISSSSL